MICGAILFACAAPPLFAAVPIPAGRDSFSCAPIKDPFVSDDPALANPIGVGPFAEGGSRIDVHLAFGKCGGAVDMYFGVYAPSVNRSAILILHPDRSLSPLSQGLIPWKANVTEAVDEVLFSDLPMKILASGAHRFYFQVTPAGSQAAYFRWSTALRLNELDALAISLSSPGRLLSWMNQNISYGWPGWENENGSMQSWKYLSPMDVYRLKEGDCTAQSGFEKYILERMGHECSLLWLERAHNSDHAVCYCPSPKGFYYIEHAFGGYEGFYGPFGSVGEIGASMYQHMVESDGLSDSYTLYNYDDVPPGVNWQEFHNLLSPL